MPSLLNRRRTLGGALTVAGAATIAATLVLTGPATTVSAGTGAVFLVITLSDSGGGQLPAGGTVTVTAAVANSAANTAIGDATPTVTVSYDNNTLSFLGNGAGWTCSTSTNAGQQICTDGTITAGGANSLPITFTVSSTALVGDNAFVTGTVSDAAADINSGSFSGQNTATDSATVANGPSYTKDAPQPAYPTKVGGDQTVANNSVSTTMMFDDKSAGVTIDIVIPAGALSSGTHVSVYRGSQAFWSGSLSSHSQAFVDGYAAAWTEQDANSPSNAFSSLTMIVSNTSVKASDTLYRVNQSGLSTTTGPVGNGAWTVSFTQDPGFVLAQAAAAATTTSSSVAPSSTITAPAGGGGGSQRARGGSTTLPISAGVLLLLCGVVVVGTGRRRQDG